MDTSPSSSLPSSPLPLSHLYSQFHNLFITLENLTARDSLSFLPLPRTCSATFHRAPCLLNSASPSQLWPLPPRGSISSSGEPKLTNPAKFFEGLQSAPSVLTCSVTEVPYHCGEPRAQWQDITGYACWGKPNGRNTILNNLEILLPKYILETSQVKQTSKIKAIPSRIFLWTTAT